MKRTKYNKANIYCAFLWCTEMVVELLENAVNSPRQQKYSRGKRVQGSGSGFKFYSVPAMGLGVVN